MLKGVVISLASSISFGLLYYLVTLLLPLTGFDLVGWRSLFMVPVLAVYVMSIHRWSEVTGMVAQVREKPWSIVYPLASAALVGLMQSLFLWAPTHGHALNVALGFFLLPLVMVVVGCVVYKERLSRLQMIAVFFAAAGVLNEVIYLGTIAWSTLAVMAIYPVYFVLRRAGGINHMGGLLSDFVLLAPFALAYIALSDHSLPAMIHEVSGFFWLFPFFILVSAYSFIWYIQASALLPLSLFGLLSYLEPVLLLGISFLLGERMQPGQWPTYLCIWVALLFLALEGTVTLRNERRFYKKNRGQA